jgi:hypothetical protein
LLSNKRENILTASQDNRSESTVLFNKKSAQSIGFSFDFPSLRKIHNSTTVMMETHSCSPSLVSACRLHFRTLINRFRTRVELRSQRAAFDKNDLVEHKGHSTRLNLNRCALSFKCWVKRVLTARNGRLRRLNLLDAQHVPLNKSRTSYDFYICRQSSLMLMKRSVQLSIHSQYLTAKYKHFESF